MNRNISRRLVAALGVSVAVAIGASSLSSAQPAPRPLPGSPSYNQDRGAAPDRHDDRQDSRRGDRLERRLEYLHSELRITPAQERLWNDFADVVRDSAERGPVRGPGFDRNRDAYRGQNRDDRRDPPSVLDRLERRHEILALQSERLDRLVIALRPLYAALSPDQKRTADRELFQPRDFGYGRGRFTQFDAPRDRPTYDREYR
jgi:hypothetical protein